MNKTTNALLTGALCLTLGCASQGTIGKGMCRHEALYAATVCAERYPARIAIGPPGHGQAQCLIDGEWRYTHMDGNEVVIAKQDKFMPDRFLSIEQFVKVIKDSYGWQQ